MRLADLQSPRKERTCLACKVMLADCIVPLGESSAPMCWLCAHQVIDHEVDVHRALEAKCDCKPEDIYPVRVLQARAVEMQKCEAKGFARFPYGYPKSETSSS